jgi:hypothetical protein
MHAPFRQVVFAVQVLKSSHAEPSLPGTAEQASLASSHEAMKQPPGGAQGLGLPPLHTPDWQVSSTLQNRPSSQAPPSFVGTEVQTAFMQTPVVQGLPSMSLQGELSFFAWALQPRTGSHTPTEHSPSKALQSTDGPFEHDPPEHLPEYVHGSPSSQAAPSLPAALPHAFFASSHAPT